MSEIETRWPISAFLEVSTELSLLVTDLYPDYRSFKDHAPLCLDNGDVNAPHNRHEVLAHLNAVVRLYHKALTYERLLSQADGPMELQLLRRLFIERVALPEAMIGSVGQRLRGGRNQPGGSSVSIYLIFKPASPELAMRLEAVAYEDGQLEVAIRQGLDSKETKLDGDNAHANLLFKWSRENNLHLTASSVHLQVGEKTQTWPNVPF